MKYLKTFEHLQNPEIGDYVLLHPDKEDLDRGFREGEIYEIITRNDVNNKYPFVIQRHDSSWRTSFSLDQVRKATPLEIDSKKYNL